MDLAATNLEVFSVEQKLFFANGKRVWRRGFCGGKHRCANVNRGGEETSKKLHRS